MDSHTLKTDYARCRAVSSELFAIVERKENLFELACYQKQKLKHKQAKECEMNRYNVIFRLGGVYVTDVTVEAEDEEQAQDYAFEDIGEIHNNWIVDEVDVIKLTESDQNKGEEQWA